MFRKIIFILGAISVAASSKCPDREATMRCFYGKADLNKDGIITRHELSKKIFSVLHWYEAAPFQLFGGINKIMADCDGNKDGKLTIEESLEAKRCMDSCFKRKTTKDKFHC